MVFDEDGSYIEDTTTKEKTRIEDVGSSYVLRLRVPRKIEGTTDSDFVRRR